MACLADCSVADRVLRTGLGAALIGAALSLVAGAQSPRPYRPGIDVRDYDITLDLPDTGATIDATVVVTFDRTSATDSLVLDLRDLHVRYATLDGRPVRFARGDSTVSIALPRTHRGPFHASVTYGGRVLDGLIVRTDSAGRWTGFGDNWPNRARHWIASVDHPSDKATVTWRVRAPRDRMVVANGRLVSRRSVHVDGRTRVETTWRESQRIPVYLMVIAAAPLARYDLGETDCGMAELQRCVPQAVYTAPEQKGMLPGPFARADDIVRLFSRLVGPFPYEKLAHLQSSTRFGGMENATAIFYADAAFRQGWMNEGLIAHETAHQWFGDAVTERRWAHLWLSEGFATYFAALWTREAHGDSAFRADMSHIRRTVLDDTISVTRRPVIDTTQSNLLALLDRNSYEKGGFVLHMLRSQLGDSAFFRGIRRYYRLHRHATAVTDDLEAAMERASGRHLAWFFDQWLRRPGYPEIAATWTYDSGTREVVVTATQNGPFGTYRLPLVVSVVDSAGHDRRATMQMSAVAGATAEVHLPCPTAPAVVRLDPDVQILARLTLTPR